MKNLLFLMSLLMLIGFSACNDDEGSIQETEVDVDSEASIESTFEDVDNIAEAGMDDNTSGRTEGERDALLGCAEVTRDDETNTITIDFGDGCTGPNGRVRTGRIIIVHDGRRFQPGAFRTITFDNFTVDTIKVEGTRTVKNISDSTSASPVFEISLTGGKLTFPDGTTATREATWTRTWERALNPLEDITRVDGSASGTNREGVEYSVDITQELVYDRGCRLSGIFIPVSGVKVFTAGENVVTIDYGDGNCDNLVTVTRNGETVEKEINIRKRLGG